MLSSCNDDPKLLERTETPVMLRALLAFVLVKLTAACTVTLEPTPKGTVVAVNVVPFAPTEPPMELVSEAVVNMILGTVAWVVNVAVRV